MTVKLSTGWIQSNSMKFKAGLIARHWTYETLNEYINASVVILPIEKISCLIMLIQRADVVDAITFLVDVSRCKRREWPSNCRWIFHNQIQNYLCRRTYDEFNSKRMSKCLRCDFAEWNSPRGPFIVVVVISKFFAKFCHCHIFQRPSSWRENLCQMQSQPFG